MPGEKPEEKETMLQFKHPHDLKQLPEVHPAYPLIKDLVERLIVDFPPGRPYTPEDDGWIVEHPHGPQSGSPRPWILRTYPNHSAKLFGALRACYGLVVGIFW